MAQRITLGLLVLMVAWATGTQAGNVPTPPGWGETTVFATGNAGLLVKDGDLGATVEDSTQTQVQNVKSVVGIDWTLDVGYSHKLIAHYEYGGQFSTLSNTFSDAKPYRSWFGLSNALGTFTYGKQPTGFFKYYGGLIDQAQEFYATGYTTSHAGGVEIESDLVKYSTSYGRLAVDVDYRPEFVDHGSPIANSIGIAGKYSQAMGRFTFAGGYLREELRSGVNVNRYGAAVEYGAEQWSIALGAHIVDDASPSDTRSYNLLSIVQLTQDNALHVSLSIIDDDDVYDSFYGAGFYLDQKIGSQWRLYSEGAVTRAQAPGGGSPALNSQILFGVRYDFGNIYY